MIIQQAKSVFRLKIPSLLSSFPCSSAHFTRQWVDFSGCFTSPAAALKPHDTYEVWPLDHWCRPIHRLHRSAGDIHPNLHREIPTLLQITCSSVPPRPNSHLFLHTHVTPFSSPSATLPLLSPPVVWTHREWCIFHTEWCWWISYTELLSQGQMNSRNNHCSWWLNTIKWAENGSDATS